MKYYIVDGVGADEFWSAPYSTPEEATEAAESEFKHLSAHDQKRRSYFYVAGVEESADGEEDRENYDIIAKIK